MSDSSRGLPLWLIIILFPLIREMLPIKVKPAFRIPLADALFSGACIIQKHSLLFTSLVSIP